MDSECNCICPHAVTNSKIKGELLERGEGIASVKTLCKDLSALSVIWSLKREILIWKKASRQGFLSSWRGTPARCFWSPVFRPLRQGGICLLKSTNTSSHAFLCPVSSAESVLSSHVLLLAEHVLQSSSTVTDSSALRGRTLERWSQKGKVDFMGGVGTPYRPEQGDFAPFHLATQWTHNTALPGRSQ